jgi:hypothetical protein
MGSVDDLDLQGRSELGESVFVGHGPIGLDWPPIPQWICWTKHIRRGADKSLAYLFAAQPKEIFLDGLKKLKQRSHKCVELRAEYVD